MKIVVNYCYGGFRPSKEFYEKYNIPYEDSCGLPYSKVIISRTDERLIEFIEKYGSKRASSPVSNLVVEDIPSGSHYIIDEYDGYESIQYKDDIKWEIAE